MLNKLFLPIALIVLIAIGCGERKNETVESAEEVYQFDSTDLKLEKVEDETGIYNLEYKFNKGDKFKYRFSSISANQQDIATDTSITTKLNQTISYIIDMKINEVDEDGVADIEFNVRSIKIDADFNGEKYNIKTDVTPDSVQKMQFAEHFALTENPFIVRVDKKGDLIEFSRIDKIVNKFLQLRELTDSVSVDDKSMLRNSFTQTAVRPLMQQIFRTLPEKQIAKDSVWSVQQQPISLMVYQVGYENIYKVLGVEKLDNDKILLIDADVFSSVSGDDKATEGGITYTFTKPKTIADGKIYFNIDKGMIQKSKTSTDMQFSMTMEAMSPQGLQKGTRKDKNISTNILELL
jgi:hypothetical protein